MRKRILYIEDDYDTRNLVKTLLENDGYVVLTASNGREGLKKLEMYDIDLVLLDIMLPDMSGWDIYRRMNEIFHPAKIAFLTIMSATEREIENLKEEGVADYITKPFDNKELIRRVRNILEVEKRILHVENDKDTQVLVRYILESNGYKVINACNGKECFNILRNEKVDLVLLDIMLPDMSGWSVFENIRKNLDNMPKIAFLSVVPISDDQLEEFRKKGVADYITKPFDSNELIRRVRMIIG